jgi:hypothetical protein
MNTNPNTLKTFNERLEYFLMYLYENGGSEYKPLMLHSVKSYHLAGCFDQDEFIRIMDALKRKRWLVFATVNRESYKIFTHITLTEAGLKKCEKASPKMPMVGLVTQDITTGDNLTDAKINHAKKLFFTEPINMESMRSACVSLAAVLEPIRKDLKTVITDADVEHFFQLVNKFDIRHNNDFTKTLHHPEQLEWVFYSLLNTINTYTKLNKRLNS